MGSSTTTGTAPGRVPTRPVRLSPPATRYVRSDGLSIAYQVLGDGPIDLVFIPSFVTNLELAWDWPPLAAFYRALASFARLILFDKRGTGLSDRVKRLPTTEQRIGDLRAVMDAARSAEAAVVGVSEGAPLAIAFAATAPERVSRLVLYAPLVKATRADDYPWAEPAEWWEAVAARFEQHWGSPGYMEADVAWRAPSEARNGAFVRWWSQYRRLGASPGAAADLARMNAQIDVRHLLPELDLPTTVIARRADRVISIEHSRFAARAIPGARYVELDGDDHLPFAGDAAAVAAAIAESVGAPGPVVLDLDACTSAGRFVEHVASRLSPRELDVLEWVARGKTNREIATALYVSESTVRKHLQHAYEKLGVNNRTAALARLSS